MHLEDEDAALAKSVLTWVCYARYPLTISALQHALLAERTDSLTSIDEGDLDDADDIIQVCNGLVVLHKDTGIVQFEHYTTLEFFTSFFDGELPEAHSTMAKAYIRYLALCDEKVESGIGFSSDLVSKYPLIKHAARNWGIHVKKHELRMQRPLTLALNFLARESLTNVAGQMLIQSGDGKTDGFEFDVKPRSGVVGMHLASFFGLTYTMNQLLNIKSWQINLCDDEGWSSLWWACYGRDCNMVEYLLMRGADVNHKDSTGDSVLIWALGRRNTTKNIDHGTIVGSDSINQYCELLLLEMDDSQNMVFQDQTLPLKTSDEIIEVLIRHSDNIDTRGFEGRTALSRAAENQQFEITDRLLERGSNIDCEDDSGNTPLLWVLQAPRRFCNFENINISQRAVVNLGFNVKIIVKDTSSVSKGTSQSATQNDQIRTALRLIGKKIDAVDHRGRAALSLAAEAGHTELVRALISAHADPRMTDSAGKTPLKWASEPFCPLVCMCKNISISEQSRVFIGTAVELHPKTAGIIFENYQAMFASNREIIRNLLLDAEAEIKGMIPLANATFSKAEQTGLTGGSAPWSQITPKLPRLNKCWDDFRDRMFQCIHIREALIDNTRTGCVYPRSDMRNHSVIFGGLAFFDIRVYNSDILAGLALSCVDSPEKGKWILGIAGKGEISEVKKDPGKEYTVSPLG